MDLIKLHKSNAEGLLARRIKYRQLPFIARRILSQLDYQLLASLTALHAVHEQSLDVLPSEEPFILFLQVFFGLQQQQDATLQALDACITAFDDKQQASLFQAMQLGSILLESHHWVPKTPELRKLLLATAVNLDPALFPEWLQQDDDSLAAACIQHLSLSGLSTNHQTLLRDLADSSHNLTQLAALQALAVLGNPEACIRLGQANPDSLKPLPTALLTACWLHPETFFEHGPLCAALTGKPEAIMRLMDDMQDVTNLHEAYTAWLWLTGRTLPHYPLLQAVDAEARHVAPTRHTAPDIEAARRWWQQQSWQSDQHYFLGRVIDPANLKNLAHTLAGQYLPLLTTHQQLQGLPPVKQPAGFCIAGEMQPFRLTHHAIQEVG